MSGTNKLCIIAIAMVCLASFASCVDLPQDLEAKVVGGNGVNQGVGQGAGSVTPEGPKEDAANGEVNQIQKMEDAFNLTWNRCVRINNLCKRTLAQITKICQWIPKLKAECQAAQAKRKAAGFSDWVLPVFDN